MDRNRLLILPEEVEDGQLVTFNLVRGPKRFILANTGLYTIQKVEHFGSAIIDNKVSGDPGLHICHQFDPIFLVLSALIDQAKFFRSARDLFEMSGVPQLIGNELIMARLLTICDQTEYEGDVMIKIDMNRFDQWIGNKLEFLISSIMETVPWASKRMSATRVAYGIIYEYVSDEVFGKLSKESNIHNILNEGNVRPVEEPKPAPKQHPPKDNKKVKKQAGPDITSYFKKK